MKRHALLALGIAWMLGAVALVTADSTKDEAIKKDRAQYEGTWRVVALEIGGSKARPEDIEKITVVNHADTWVIQVDGNAVAKGTSTIDPTKQPKTIDFTPTEGGDQGKVFRGIYELQGNTRRLCFAQPGQDRPTTFASKPGRDNWLVIFERVSK